MVKFGRHLQFLRQEQRTPAYLVEYKKISALLGQEDTFSAAWCGALSKTSPTGCLGSTAREAAWLRLTAPGTLCDLHFSSAITVACLSSNGFGGMFAIPSSSVSFWV